MIFSKLLTRVRCRFAALHLSADLQHAYLDWINVYIRFHAYKHPALMGEREILAFLRHLATERAATTDQLTQAQQAIQALYCHVLDNGVERLPAPVRRPAQRSFESLFAPARVDGTGARRPRHQQPESARYALPASATSEPTPAYADPRDQSWSTAA